MFKTQDLQLHAKNMLIHNYKITSENRVLILFDTVTQLSGLLKDAFESACVDLKINFEVIDFYSIDSQELMDNINTNYKEDDLVILCQSSSFRVSKFRWRNELCAKGLKVLEFGHLDRIELEEYNTYIDSLTYDYPHYEKLNAKLVPMIERANSITILSENGSKAMYEGKMDKIILNDGNFEGHTNFGSRFPIGEIVSEGLELSSLNGELEVYAFPNLNIATTFVKPFTIKIKDGLVVSHNGPKDFSDIVDMIKTEHPEGKVYVREFGIGTNRYIPRMSRMGDPIAYERQEGLHFSLGMKHGIYQKKLWPKYGKKFFQRYHIDVYVNMDKMFIDSELVYEKDKGYLV